MKPYSGYRALWGIFFLILSLEAQGQQASFNAPDTICQGMTLPITNNSTGASTYFWNFCTSGINLIPQSNNITWSGGQYMTLAQDGYYYYGLSVNAAGHLIVLNFGTNTSNIPFITDLGTCGILSPNGRGGMQILKVGGVWTLIVLNNDNILKILLGASLATPVPVATNWGNQGSLNNPAKLQVFQDLTGVYYGFTVNTSGTITKFVFGTDFSGAPTGYNLGNAGGYFIQPSGLYVIEDGGNWLVYVVDQQRNYLIQYKFGTSLMSTPVVSQYSLDPSLTGGYSDVYLMDLCGQWYCYLLSAPNNAIIQFDLGLNIETPAATGYEVDGEAPLVDQPISFSNAVADVGGINVMVSSDNTTHLQFSGFCGNISTAQTPGSEAFGAGNYIITLMTDVGLPTQKSACHSVVAVLPPILAPVKDTFFCTGQPLLYTVPQYPGASYQWSNGSDSATDTFTTGGTYTLTLNDYACLATQTVNVSQQTTPSLSLPKDTVFCDTGVIKYVTTQPVTYIWNTGAILDSIIVKASGVYWLQLNQLGCTAFDSTYCKVVPAHLLPFGKDTSFCGPGVLSYQSADNATYLWSTGSDSTTTLAWRSGLYWLAVTDSGCTSRDSIQTTVVALPAVSLPGDTLFCDSGVLKNPTTLPVTYQWSTGATADSIIVKSSGNYSLVMTNAGCSVNTTLAVSVYATPTLSLPKDTLFCGSGNLGYQSTLPVTYTWSNGQAGPYASISSSGLYWLALNNQGCIARDSSTVTVIPLPVVNLGPDSVLCFAQPDILNAGNPGDTYLWQDGSTAQTYAAASPGEYKVTVTTQGCSVSDSVLLQAQSIPYFSLGGNQPICPGEILYLRPNPDTLTFTWSSGSTDSILIVTQPGLVWATGRNYCSSYTDTVNITEGICVVHVPSAFTPNGDGINDLFKVLGVEAVDQFSLRIFNRWGQTIFYSQDKNSGWDGSVGGEPAPVGAYVYELHFRYQLTGVSYRMQGTVSLMR